MKDKKNERRAGYLRTIYGVSCPSACVNDIVSLPFYYSPIRLENERLPSW